VRVQALGVVPADLLGAAARVVDHRAVPGEHADRSQPVDLAERAQVRAERIGRRVRPAADVRGDLLEQHVAAEETPAALAVQRDVPVGVAGQHQHAEGLTTQVDRVAGADEPGGHRGVDGRALLGVG
jgi:hypothetical protein